MKLYPLHFVVWENNQVVKNYFSSSIVSTGVFGSEYVLPPNKIFTCISGDLLNLSLHLGHKNSTY